ncbi:MAG: 50S ribosomal protein L17 [Candidatus Eisenbacteria bacterium]|nr:50S ribosomal protein L17 [Candidatus Eisenbacteria bacterium]
MKHLKEGRKLSRTASHRRAMLRNLTTSLFEHERIETTLEKAKEARRVAERMITYAKRDSTHARRLVARTVRDPLIVRKLFDTIAPWYADRPGGYTRILRTRSRLGDAGEMAILELVKSPEQRAAEAKAREKAAKDAEKEAKKAERNKRILGKKKE